MIVVVVLWVLAPRVFAADDFEVQLKLGKDQVRAAEAPGVESFMRMGMDPAAPAVAVPAGRAANRGEWTLRVQVPEQWVTNAGERRVVTIPEYMALADDEVAALARAVADAGWGTPGEELATTRRVVALLHVAAPNGERPLGPDSGIWRPWELVADPEHADTFSAALVSMLVLERLRVDVHLALYPSGTTEAYGVVVSGVPTTSTPDVLLATPGRSLVSCHRKAPPTEPPLAEWSHADIVAPGWTPQPAPATEPLPSAMPPVSAASPESGSAPDRKWLVLTALVVVSGAAALGFSALTGKRRRERVAARQASARKDSFS